MPPQSTPKVFVSVHGRFHAFELAMELYHHHLLAGLATTYPAFITHRFLPNDIPLQTMPALEITRRLHTRLPESLSKLFELDTWLAKRFSHFVAHRLPKDLDVLIAWSGAAKEIIPIAHNQDSRVILERGSTHIAHQAEILNEAFDEFGITAPSVPQEMIEREMAEYEMADTIAVPTHYAASTFHNRGINPEKTIVNPYGVSLDRFFSTTHQEDRAPEKPIRILFAGRVDIRKGIPWLLRAFAPLAGEAELHLVGPVPKTIEDILKREPLTNVIIHGSVPSTKMPAIYQAADIFCLPSLEEGFALVLLQAMASGLPIVASNVSGAEDLVTIGKEGLIVPPRNSEALTEALSQLVRDHEKRREMGLAARKRVEQGYSWSDYGLRAVKGIEKVLKRSTS